MLETQCPGLCSSRARWPLVPNFFPQVTSKSQIFHANHMPGTLDFAVSEHWAPFNFPYSTALSAPYKKWEKKRSEYDLSMVTHVPPCLIKKWYD